MLTFNYAVKIIKASHKACEIRFLDNYCILY